MKKYAVHPGWMYSKNDRDKHYISAPQLIALYGVDPRECAVWDRRWMKDEGFIHLYPDYHGNYVVPTRSDPSVMPR